MKHDYEYVHKKEYMPVKKSFIQLINEVQDEIRDKFTFQFNFIGSTCRNMITRDNKSNIGYDFDVDIYPNINFDDYSPKKLRNIFITAFKKHGKKYGYSCFEDSTRVITIKVVDKQNSKILHSCDVAIVYDYDEETSLYIHYNKKQNTYEWQERIHPTITDAKADRIKRETDYGWDECKDLYISLKNNNSDFNKKSRSLYSEAVSSIFNQYFLLQ